MNFALLNNVAELCSKKGITQAVLCPGSRSAPITLAFLRHKKFKCWTFSDERSAAFIALGMAQQSKTPVVLVCTSGSAAYNFAPAVAEAFFQQIPIILLTADRPGEWIDQMDGQTMRQSNLYGRHVKHFYELPTHDPHPDAQWHAGRIINEAINLSSSGVQGPVHINIPLREPLYSKVTDSKIDPFRIVQPEISTHELDADTFSSLVEVLKRHPKILFVPGQQEFSADISQSLKEIHRRFSLPVVGDILSNLHSLNFFCSHTDTFLGQISDAEKESLQPDLVITFGKSLVAKNLKTFLRAFRPQEHWHLQIDGEPADTFQSLTKIIRVNPANFLDQFAKTNFTPPASMKGYGEKWVALEKQAVNSISAFFKEHPSGEFSFIQRVLQSLPQKCNLHLANSMTVRYANHIGLSLYQSEVQVFSNRGTSGIDGCTSTAVGAALTLELPHVLITGDQAFFYDRNAFWHNYELPNLFVVILNNHGGIIFNLIDGPGGLPEADEFFITRQKLNAQSLAGEFGFHYKKSEEVQLKDFFNKKNTVGIVESESTQEKSKKIFEEFKSHIRKSYEK